MPLDFDVDAATDRLCDFLRIPSVSTDPAYADQVRQGAQWVADHLRQSGFDPTVCQTAGHPCVIAKTTEAMVVNPASPRVLFYGHYDVQPPDPVELWTTGPFDPTVRDGKLYARGASDDKGQVLCFLEALRAYHEAGRKLPCHVTVLIEGEEECGSVSLPAFVREHRDALASDVALVSDTSMWDVDPKRPPVPAITYAMRGLVYFDVQLHGPTRDLHSGVYGGTLANPANLLIHVLGQLIDKDQRITLPGFYDDVAPLDETERQQWRQLGFDEQAFLGDVGASAFGEKGFSTLQRKWSRPSCDINGLYGGYMHEGAKTVIPTFAGAKVSFRIPANMNPQTVAETFTRWLKSHDVGGCRWRITDHGQAHPAAAATDSTWMTRAQQAIEHVCGQPPVLVREGATIPIVADFKTILGLDTLLVGFGLNSDQIHSPDEHFALDRYQLGIQIHAALLAHFAS